MAEYGTGIRQVKPLYELAKDRPGKRCEAVKTCRALPL